MLLITGGTGLSGGLPYLRQYLNLLTNDKNDLVTINMRLIWATKQSKMAEKITRREFANVSPNSWEHVKAEFYITGHTEDLEGEDARDKEEGNFDGRTRLVVRRGRQDVRRMVGEIVEDKGSGRLAVVVCCPSEMADEVRDAVRKVLGRGVQGVEFLDEAW